MSVRVILVLLLFASTAQAQPNILHILIDDLGWTDTSIQYDPNAPDSKSDFYQTPVLEQLAAEGMRFTDAYSSNPNCSPTRAAIQTGKSPAQLQMTDHILGGVVNSSRREKRYHDRPLIPPMPWHSIPDDEITIAEQLKAGNPDYRTSHHGKWGIVSPEYELPGLQDVLNQGYDVATDGIGVFPAGTDPKLNEGIALQAMDFMAETVALGRPFYTQISFKTVHTPFEAKQETLDKYYALPPGERHTLPIYAAMVEEMDTTIGTLLDKLVDLGIDDETYVIFTSDNGGKTSLGYGTSNVPLYNGKGAIWEGGIRVPLIIKGPGIAGDSVNRTPVITHDLFPTINDLAGNTNAEPNGVEGASLAPLLFGTASSVSRANGPNGELFWHYPHYTGSFKPCSAIRDGNYKLIRFYGENGADDKYFLFDLSQSLTESKDVNSPLNLADDMPELVATLEAKLDNWLTAVGASLPRDAGADFNQDGVVNDLDLSIWEQGYGTLGTVPFQPGDTNGNAITDGLDFLRWQRERNAAAVVATATVPEPSSLALCLLLMMAPALSRLRTQRAVL